MTFDAEQVTPITFDTSGTLVDVDPAEKALADRVADREPVSRLRRTRSLEFRFVVSLSDVYQPFYAINRDALQHALDAHGVDPSTENATGASRSTTNSMSSATSKTASHGCGTGTTTAMSSRTGTPRCSSTLTSAI